MACVSPGDCETPQEKDTQMSDEETKMYCEQCEKYLDTIVTADGFCVDCLEYLCATCIRYHKRYNQQHTLQDNASMPQDFCFDKCQKHPKEMIKFYCKFCETTACPTCKAGKHGECKTVFHIPSLVQSGEINNEARQLTLLIDDTIEELIAIEENVETCKKKARSNRKTASTAIKKHKDKLKSQLQDQYKSLLIVQDRHHEHLIEKQDKKRAEIIERLDKEKADLLERLQQEKSEKMQQLKKTQTQMFEDIDTVEDYLHKKSRQINRTDSNKLTVVEHKIHTTEKNVTAMKKVIEKKMKTGEKCGIFVATKSAKLDLKELQIDIQKAKEDIEINYYEFQEEKETINLNFCDHEVKFGCLLDKSEAKRTITPSIPINVRTLKDDKKSFVTGMCKLGNHLVVADNENGSIKLIYTTENCPITFIRLQNKPFDVACVDQDKVATTLPQVGKIMFLGITQMGKFSILHEIVVGKTCMGIEYLKPNLIVSFQDPAEVKIMSTSGTPRRTFSHVNNPTYIKLGPNNKLYIQDITKDGTRIIKKMTCDGNIDADTILMGNCDGLAVDTNGSVYLKKQNDIKSFSRILMPYFVWNTNINGIYQLSASLKTKHKLEIDGDLPDTPSCMFFCNQEVKLYVGTKSDNIVTYKIS